MVRESKRVETEETDWQFITRKGKLNQGKEVLKQYLLLNKSTNEEACLLENKRQRYRGIYFMGIFEV